jgi:hypothetical protein
VAKKISTFPAMSKRARPARGHHESGSADPPRRKVHDMRGDFLPPDEAREYGDRIIELRARTREEREQRRGILDRLYSLPASALTRLHG